MRPLDDLEVLLPEWWKEIDQSTAWQRGAYDTLALAYLAIAVVALVQIIRIQLRVPEYGWTTQKVFHLLNFLVCGLRSGVFAFRGEIQQLPLFVVQAGLLDLPGLLFFSTYTLLVLFWAEIYYQARSMPTTALRPTFVIINIIVYGIQSAIWVFISMAKTSQAQLGKELSGCFLACVSASAACAFLLFGGRLFFMLRHFPIESRGRNKKLREVGLVTFICAASFLFRATITAWSAFDQEDADLDVLKHPLLNLIYYGGAEVIPSALVLFILRKLPPKKAPAGYSTIPTQ